MKNIGCEYWYNTSNIVELIKQVFFNLYNRDKFKFAKAGDIVMKEPYRQRDIKR